MYEDFFGLHQRPFSNVPNADDFVPLAPLQDALDSLAHCISQSRGIAVVTSVAGMGKTTLCKRLARLLEQNHRSLFLSAGGMETRLSLLQGVLFELNMGYVGLSDQEARLKILQAARGARQDRRRFLLIVDEAHLLTPRLFEELRTLTEYAPDGESLIHVVLCGSFELEETLADPAMSAFSQRIGLQVCLGPLSMEDSARLLSERLKACGAADILSIMTEPALELICQASDGNQRCLTQLTDHACMLAFADGQKPLDARTVRAALADLKELPLRWNEIPDEVEEPELQDQDQSMSDHLSEIGFSGSDAIAIPRPRTISPTDQETDEFLIPEFLRLDDGSLTSAQSLLDEHPAEHSAEVSEQPISPLQIAKFEPEAELAIFEVGAGIPDTSVDSQPSDTEPQPAELHAEQPLPSHARIYEFPQQERGVSDFLLPAAGQMTETPVVDRYTVLDRMYELPEERRHAVDLFSIPPEPAVSSWMTTAPAATHPEKQSALTEISEEYVLELVQQIRQSVKETLSPTTHSRHPVPEPHHSVPLTAKQPELHTAPQPAAPTAKQEEAKPDESSSERRFAHLFTRLRQRRRKFEEDRSQTE